MTAAAVGLTACAPEPGPVTSPSPTATAEPAAYSGPLVFVGDELALLVPSAEEIAGVLPGITEVSEASSSLEQISDGGGPEPAPTICAALFAEQSLWSVGARSVSWKTSEEASADAGFLHVLAFADEAQAQARMDQLLDAAEQCESFDYNGPAAFDAVVAAPSDNARALAGTLSVSEQEGGWSIFTAFASVGNVVVQLWQPAVGENAPDAEAVATLLQERAELARTGLIDELTTHPPATEDEPTTDASSPWSDWVIASGGVGPMTLGATVEMAIAGAQAARVVDPEYDGGPWKIVNADDSASLLISAQEQDGTSVASITVGNGRTLDDIPQDGAALPSRGGVRVGDPVVDAITAFPGGTIVSVVSSGDEWYDVSTRDGHVFRFHADKSAADASAVVVGITVEDATMRRGVDFG